MFDKSETYRFLKSNGFGLAEQSTSEYFGDYIDVFSSSDFELIFSSSKSVDTVDLRDRKEKEDGNIYDLALVKALLYNEQALDKPTTIEEHCKFLQSELDNIRNLFRKSNYPATKRKLENLRNMRANQMFPGMMK